MLLGNHELFTAGLNKDPPPRTFSEKAAAFFTGRMFKHTSDAPLVVRALTNCKVLEVYCDCFSVLAYSCHRMKRSQ